MIFLKAILIDDEPLALDYLEHEINTIGNVEVIGKYIEVEVSKIVTQLQAIDIVFLDIEMPRINGLELAEKLLEINPCLSIIFVTAFESYAVKAFELNALDYILKPVQRKRLQKTLERVNTIVHPHQALSSYEKLRINVCGELSFAISKDFQFLQWRTTKSQELFLYLLLYSGKSIRKSELTEVIWPELDHSKAYAQLYNAIYHVRKTLKNFKNHFILRSVTEGYILTTKNVSINLVEWEIKLTSAPPLRKGTVETYEKMMKLYTDSYLHKYDYLWAEAERYRLDQLWTKVAYQLATFYLDHDQLDKAETWYVRICKLRPEEETAQFALMKLYARLGLGMLVNHHYIHSKAALEELGIPMSAKVKQWYDQWNLNRTK